MMLFWEVVRFLYSMFSFNIFAIDQLDQHFGRTMLEILADMAVIEIYCYNALLLIDYCCWYCCDDYFPPILFDLKLLTLVV